MLHKKDWEIIHYLKKNGRDKSSMISKKLNMPRSTINDRIKKLVNNGIIRRFTIQLDHEKIELPTCVYVFVSITPNNVTHRQLAKKIASLPGVCEIHMVTGKYDLLVKIRGKSIEEIGKVVVEKLRVIHGVGQTFTSASFETIKEEN